MGEELERTVKPDGLVGLGRDLGVQHVVHDRNTERGEVDAELVGASGGGVEFEECEAGGGVVGEGVDEGVGVGLCIVEFAGLEVVSGEVDVAASFGGEVVCAVWGVDDGEVGLVCFAVGEQGLVGATNIRVEGAEQDACSAFVEAVS